MTYQRVIPRDLFNESKLLKCLGKVVLWHANGMLPDLDITFPWNSEFLQGGPFEIEQDPSSGNLSCSNIAFVRKHDGEHLYLYTIYNSKESWPLYFADEHEEFFGPVFAYGGEEISKEFSDYIRETADSAKT